MRLFVGCFLAVIWYTLGMLVLCGLAVEGCYRLCFRLIGRRQGRALWFATSFLGTPVHELGHAAMCLLFGHRIEKIRLFPNRRGVALVQHTYNRKNPWATMGNLFIGIGPILAGLAVMLAILALIYPASLQAFHAAEGGGMGTIEALFNRIWQLFRGLLWEETRPVWARIVAVILLLCVALHVRLSTADLRGMQRGLPIYLILCALLSAVVAIMGQGAYDLLVAGLASFGSTVLMLFGIILLFALVQLVLVLIYRMLAILFTILFARSPSR